MDRTIISWNLPNWVSIVIMAAAGYAVLALIAQMIQRKQAAGGTAGG